MAESVESLVLKLKDAPANLVVDVPVLLWENANIQKQEPVLTTMKTGMAPRPVASAPVALRLRKAEKSGFKPFMMGITLGRADNNDVPLDDASVSRFHAYFRDEGNNRWSLVDAESLNGTWASAVKLTPNQAVTLTDGMQLAFGDVNVTFMLPEAFQLYLKTRLNP